MASSDTIRSDQPPSWDGSLSTLVSYERELRWYVMGTDPDKRDLCGPRAVRALTGRAREIVTAMSTADIARVSARTGCDFLVQYIKSRVGDPPVSEVAKYMDEYLSNFHREKNEAMGAYIARSERLYGRLTEALQAVMDSNPPEAGDDGEPPELPQLDANWLPGLVRGWLLLTRARLSDAEQASAISSCGNSYDVDALSVALRTQWTEGRLRNHDRNLNFGGTTTGHSYEAESLPEEDEDLTAILEEAIKEVETEPMLEEVGLEEAYATAQEGARTWARARAALRSAKTARGFYGASPSSRPSGSSTDARRGDAGSGFSGKCLRCGRVGHRARECPQSDPRSSAAPRGGVGTFSAGFMLVNAPVDDADSMYLSILDATAEGYVALDCGATSSIGGVEALTTLADLSAESVGGETIVDTSVQIPFRFGNGARQHTVSRVAIPTRIGKHEGLVHYNVLDAESPALLGMDFLRKSGAVIDFNDGTACFTRLSPEKHTLKRLSSGHLALNMTAKRGDPDDAAATRR
jgi:hypothetical protein